MKSKLLCMIAEVSQNEIIEVVFLRIRIAHLIEELNQKEQKIRKAIRYKRIEGGEYAAEVAKRIID